ncbi:MFS transporter [Desulfobulbus alkaliphilus]|uniref:MFS transporter n=1 Tax=Desulfobulbus alkaliphilus TaxID=869814 RepID=UPI00196395D4|nr:MFS transporter [Desulfobulbus alkaliphilus]MBM9536951.1 MFS transporter [Desulfobulbus alkaliphilus]
MAKAHPSPTLALWALMFGNFVIGTGVLAPAGMIKDLSRAFGVDVATVALLIAYGGALLCFQSPLLALVTNRLDRRYLLTGALLLFAMGHLFSALATNFSMLLTIRLIMIASAAVFTPQAASTLALFLPVERRSGAIAFLFIGWSLASAIGIPMVNLVSGLIGWQAVYLGLATACALTAVAVASTLPAGLRANRLSLGAWRKLLSGRKTWLLLSITALTIAGQNVKYPYIVVEIHSRLNASPAVTATLLAVYGAASIIGTMIASRVIFRLGPRNTVNFFLCILFMGLFLWAGEWAILPLTVFALFIWGLGTSPAVSSQQARLVDADPDAASASTSLNTSFVYMGQAAGTALGGQLLVTGHSGLASGLALTLLALALVTSLLVAQRLRI